MNIRAVLLRNAITIMRTMKRNESVIRGRAARNSDYFVTEFSAEIVREFRNFPEKNIV